MKPLFLIGSSVLCLLLGCGGSGSGPVRGGSNSPKLTVLLGSNSDSDLEQAVLSVEKVEISTDGATWASLGTPKATYDLMALQGGREAVLISEAPVTAGTYTFRLTWATTNYADGTKLPAYVDPVVGSGTALSMPVSTIFQGTVTVPSSSQATTRLAINPSTSILRLQGATTSYVFTSEGSTLDTAELATIKGTVHSGGAALAGAEVFAEVIDGLNNPRIVQRAFCDASGQYTLNALPARLGGSPTSIYVVAMPSSAAQAFSAQGVGPVVLGTPGVVEAGKDLDFSGLSTSASISLTVTPQTPLGGLTVAELRQTLAFGTSSQYVIVRSHGTTIGTSEDTYGFGGLGGGTYGVVATRGLAVKASLSQVRVNPGDSASLTLTFP